MLKEWFILRIISTAQVGLKLEPYFAFDLLMYEDCMEFAMELCQAVPSSVDKESLYLDLGLMHRLHLVHLDIKPENVMLSPALKKPVLIDFGLANLIPEEIG